MITDIGTLLEFDQFLIEVDQRYRQEMLLIPLFSSRKPFTQKQKKIFAAVFYHLRGHFINFLWYIGNFSENVELKKIIINNISEELGIDSRLSHEKLYERFAQDCGVDIKDEIVNEIHYLPFAREFNKAHLRELRNQDEAGQVVILAAYERLDNIDYIYLTQLAKRFLVSSSATAFFRVHVNVEHFHPLKENLISIWNDSPEKIKKGFLFTYSHQLRMWQQLSDLIFSFF